MTIRWGIIGLGNIAHAFKEALSVVEDAQLVAVASRKLDKAKKFINNDSSIKTYGTYQDLVKDEEVDVVYIATPHPFHKEYIEMCLKSNKAVLCEKPLTLNAKQAVNAYQIAKEHNLFLMEAMWTKFLPVMDKVRAWVNQIGRVKMIKADFGFRGAYHPKNRLYNIELGGGGLLDIGIYPLTFVTMFLGYHPQSIKSEVHIGKTSIDEQASILIKYNEDQIADISYSFTTQLQNTAFIYGTNGEIEIPNFWMADCARLYLNNELQETFNQPFRKNGYEYEIEEVNRCIKNRQGTSSIHSMDDTIRTLEIMDDLRNNWNLKYPNE